MKKDRSKLLVFFIGLVGVYLATHLLSLTKLPVFADESIYIRWAQLIMDDWSRYLFFPLSDGKTPLFIWSLVPFQYLFDDPLLAGRFLSVLVGLVQVFVMGWIAKSLGGKRKAIGLSMLLVTILPFWFFHHRMALMDGMLTLWLSLTFLALVKVHQALPSSKIKLTRSHIFRSVMGSNKSIKWVVVGGVFFGLSILTKLPAVLFLPTIGLMGLVLSYKSKAHRLIFITRSGLVVLIGLSIFALLKLTPTFGQLFSRGSDFLYPVNDVLLGSKWQHTLINFPSYISYFTSYLTLPVVLINFASLFSKKKKRTHLLLFLSALGFILPIGLLGRVVYARYLFPAAIFLTVGAALAIEEFIESWVITEKVGKIKVINTLLLVSLLLVTVQRSFEFIAYSLVNPSLTPFVQSDAEQYLLKWSSGHGITESVSLIQDQAKQERVAVATEGFFGTLPDAILMYLHNQDVRNIMVEGIGVPVGGLTDDFISKSVGFDRVLLVVNSHRLTADLDQDLLVTEFCRPHGAPCLQVWDVTSLRTKLNNQ